MAAQQPAFWAAVASVGRLGGTGKQEGWVVAMKKCKRCGSQAIASNMYLRTTWSNYTHAVLIESHPFEFITRSYEDKVVREYK